MDTKKVLADYSRYYEALEKMGNMPLSKTPTINDLDVSKAQLQSGYKEMKEAEFEGNFIDYLCLISTRFVIYQNRGDIAEHLKDYNLSDVKNLLRLLMKFPDYYFNESGLKPDKEAFKKLAGLWFELNQKNA